MPTRSLLPTRLYLASRSPRRRDLLLQIGISFDPLIFRQAPREDHELDETPQTGEDAASYVERLARNKAEHGWRIVKGRNLRLQPVLAADTTVELNGQVIGKPADAVAAQDILHRLSGQTHRVLTAVAISFQGRLDTALSCSEVRFRTLEDDEIRRYVATGEPMDKAGAYAIQGRAAVFVEHLAGSYSGVMGLPLYETAQLLKAFQNLPTQHA
ncbi:MAG TPA: Maf family protein [Accumulibacter sp.]|uniref:Maf family protein n=1 Tax=Accumulibacter sp. TaxID=2053492 RepID=UPI002B9D21AB|nr:Maf family protein [Accumulibacter sp.]HNG16878.1 Maf family protein [Accumulibacter sp.]HNG88393.1 Maf family protein [Accumulibacter sp.]HNK04660.1 Maf family protein [Accumulibacter sp.]HNM65652.1 Maf family protein [Accumulibacter sp.]HNN85571.1 Maf family protein [Accumulibacter sp.]